MPCCSLKLAGSTRTSMFIQPASRSPPGQVWKHLFYHFGSLFESIVTPWGHFWRSWDAAFRFKNRLWRQRCPMTPQHRNLLILLDPFCDPKNHFKKVTGTFFKGVRKGIQKQAHIQEAQKLYFVTIYYTWARSDVSEMDPFWELLEDKFCTKCEKMRKRRMPTNWCRKKVTLRKFEDLSEDP